MGDNKQMIGRPRVGDMIHKYVIIEFLNQGNSGLVYSARNSIDSCRVVLKFIGLSGEWRKKEFEREVNHLKICADCPLVVTLKDSFQYQQFGVVVLEYLQGDLLDVLQNSQSLSTCFVKDIFFQICVSVVYIHKKRIAHLDIKPENIFMANETTIKLGDFGSSYQWFGDFQEKIGAVGTYYYCAPEVGSKPYDPRKADVWSLGILLHVLLTGFWPFKEANDATLRESVVNGKIYLFTHLLPMESNLLTLLHGMLCIDPRERLSVSNVLASAWLTSINPNPRTQHPILEETIVIETEEEVREERTPKGIFSLSDEEEEGHHLFLDISPEDSWEIDPPNTNSQSDSSEDYGLAGSLPRILVAEKIKEPKTFISPTPTNNSSVAAPIGPRAKRSRRSSIVKFFTTKRRSSAIDGFRTKKRDGHHL